MTNPFNEKNENDKFQLFNGITKAINDWMIEKYPEFDSNLINKLKQVQNNHEKLELMIKEHQNKLQRQRDDFVQTATRQLNQFLEKEYPEIDRKLMETAKKLETQSKKMEEKLKIVVKSNAIYEDVYKMRDEMVNMKKQVESFTDKLKKVFK